MNWISDSIKYRKENMMWKRIYLSWGMISLIMLNMPVTYGDNGMSEQECRDNPCTQWDEYHHECNDLPDDCVNSHCTGPIKCPSPVMKDWLGHFGEFKGNLASMTFTEKCCKDGKERWVLTGFVSIVNMEMNVSKNVPVRSQCPTHKPGLIPRTMSRINETIRHEKVHCRIKTAVVNRANNYLCKNFVFDTKIACENARIMFEAQVQKEWQNVQGHPCPVFAGFKRYSITSCGKEYAVGKYCP